jgi:hypothetical protein
LAWLERSVPFWRLREAVPSKFLLEPGRLLRSNLDINEQEENQVLLVFTKRKSLFTSGPIQAIQNDDVCGLKEIDYNMAATATGVQWL